MSGGKPLIVSGALHHESVGFLTHVFMGNDFMYLQSQTPAYVVQTFLYVFDIFLTF